MFLKIFSSGVTGIRILDLYRRIMKINWAETCYFGLFEGIGLKSEETHFGKLSSKKKKKASSFLGGGGGDKYTLSN